MLAILRHLSLCRLCNSKETLLDIRDPDVGFIRLPEGSYFSCNVEQQKKECQRKLVLFLLHDYVNTVIEFRPSGGAIPTHGALK